MSVQETHVEDSQNSNECDNIGNSDRIQKSSVQETHVDISQNSNECDNPGNFDGIQKSLKESEKQLSVFIPHGNRLSNSTFYPHPITPLISLSQIQKNVLCYSEMERRRLQYDNAWDNLENGDSRLSSISLDAVTTKQLGTSYVFVGSVQEQAQEIKAPFPASPCFTDVGTDTSQYSGDTEYYKSKKSCSIKRICKFFLWTILFLGISAVVAISTINYQRGKVNPSAKTVNAQMLNGNNEINKTLTSSFKVFDNSIKKAIKSIKILFEEYGKNFNQTINVQTQRSPVYSGPVSGPDTGGQCQNTTDTGCVEDCFNMCDGNYQSCYTCKGYVTCANFHNWTMICTKTKIDLFWDDNLKACELTSSTCTS